MKKIITNTFSPDQLSCFSPPVMIATFLIEIVLAAYVVARYKVNKSVRLILAVLVLLAIFQLAEFFVCEGSSLYSSFWAKIGFVAITFLPPVGLHIIHDVYKRKSSAMLVAAYTTAVMWIPMFLFADIFNSSTCGGNYIIFALEQTPGLFYSFYYFGWLITGLIAAFVYNLKANTRQHLLLTLMVFGYLSFLVPMAITMFVSPETRAGIPSIMCGFAVLFAVILTFGVLPHLKKR